MDLRARGWGCLTVGSARRGGRAGGASGRGPGGPGEAWAGRGGLGLEAVGMDGIRCFAVLDKRLFSLNLSFLFCRVGVSI